MSAQAWWVGKGPGDFLPPDDSLVIAAEAEYIANSIGESLIHLNDAKVAAGNENVWKAKQHIQCALDCLSDLVED